MRLRLEHKTGKQSRCILQHQLHSIRSECKRVAMILTFPGAPLAYSHLQQAVKTSENVIREFYGVHAVDGIYK